MLTVDAPHTRRAFGARLKGERERRGRSLAAISDVTKVNASLLEALERGDASRWPKGIYRRAFFREYLAVIGLPSDPYVTEFLELFPDGEERPATAPEGSAPAVIATAAPRPGPAAPGGAGPATPLRLTFGDGSAARWVSRLRFRPESAPDMPYRRAAAGALDLLAVGATALLTAWLAAGIDFWAAAGVIAVIYYSAGTLVWGRSPGSAWLSSGETSRIAFPSSWRTLLPVGASVRSTGAVLRSRLIETSRFFKAHESRTQHDLAEVRRRRVEQAKRNSDKIEAIG